MRSISLAGLIVLVFFTFFISAVDAAPFSRYEYKIAFDEYKKRIVGDLFRAGFKLDVGTPKEIIDGSAKGIFVDVQVKKYPESLKKYFGEPGPHSFRLQLVELQNTIVFSIKTQKEGKPAERFTFFRHIDKKDFYYFDFKSLVGAARTELVLALYDLDCQSRYGGLGYTQKRGEKNPLFLPVRNFPYSVDEFITLFFKELKSYGFKYTVVERYPSIEIRIFGFPSELSLLLSEPANAFFLLENNKSTDLKEILYIYRTDRAYREKRAIEIIVFDNSFSLEKRAAESAKNVFTNLYVPDCPQYDSGYGP